METTIRPGKSVDYMKAELEGVEPAFSSTYIRNIHLSSKDAIYFAMVIAHAEAREKSRLISKFAGQLLALNEINEKRQRGEYQ
jgi:hypothetical protein